MRIWFVVFLLCSCSARDRLLQFNIGTEALQLDWNRTVDPNSVVLLDNIMEGLTTYASSEGSNRADLIRPGPALAASWVVTENGTKYRFKLRPDVFWSDGVVLTAQHFVDSWERLLSPKNPTSNAYHLFDVENAQAYSEGKLSFSEVGIKAIGYDILEVKLRRHAPYFLHLVASVNTFPIRKDLMEKGPQWIEPDRLVTLGPYRISEWVHGDHILLDRNKSYWGRRPEVSQVLCRLVTEPLTALTLYQNGKLDIIPRDLPSSFVKILQSNPDYRSGSKLSVNYLVFNTKRVPFNRPAKRRAFIQSMNRALFASFFMGAQTPTSSWIPPGMIGYHSDVGIPTDGTESILFRGETIDIRYSGSDTWNLVFQAMEKIMDEKLRLKAKLDQLDTREYRDFLNQLANPKHGKEVPHIFHLTWVADYPDPHSFMNVFTSGSESNYTGWKNPEYDALVEKAVASDDDELRGELYQKAQKILLEDEAVIMPLFFTSHQALVRQEIKGVRLNALDKWYFKNIRFESDSWVKSLGRSFMDFVRGSKAKAVEEI